MTVTDSANVVWDSNVGKFDSGDIGDFLPLSGGTLSGPLNASDGINMLSESDLVFHSPDIGQITFSVPSGEATITGGDYGAPYVQISQLTVTPGTTALAGVTVNGNAQVNGTLTSTSTLTSEGWIYANGNHVFFASGAWIRGTGSSVDISGQLNAGGWVNSAVGYYFHANGAINLNWDGASIVASHQLRAPSAYFDGHIVTNGYWAAWSNNFGGNAIVNGVIQAQGRLISNAWDIGTANSLGGSLDVASTITAHGGVVYMEGSRAVYWTWNGNLATGHPVRSEGNITTPAQVHCTHLNTPADVQGAAPGWVAGQNGDGFLRWYPLALLGSAAAWRGTVSGQLNGAVGGPYTIPVTGHYILAVRDFEVWGPDWGNSNALGVIQMFVDMGAGMGLVSWTPFGKAGGPGGGGGWGFGNAVWDTTGWHDGRLQAGWRVQAVVSLNGSVGVHPEQCAGSGGFWVFRTGSNPV